MLRTIKALLRRKKSFERLTGIRMWNRFGKKINVLENALLDNREGIFNRTSGFFRNTNTDWAVGVDHAVHQFYMSAPELDLRFRTTSLLTLLKEAREKLNWACPQSNKYYPCAQDWHIIISDCETVMLKYIEYCNEISALDTKKTWASCELAVYLTHKQMEQETAVKICKELGAIKKEHLTQINQNDIYGDVKDDYAGLSLSISEKNELHQIWLTARAESVGATVTNPIVGTTASLEANLAALKALQLY